MVPQVTCDGEDCGRVAEGDKLVFATAVIDDNFHVVGAKGDVVSANAEGGGRSIRHLPVTSYNAATETAPSHAARGEMQITQAAALD